MRERLVRDEGGFTLTEVLVAMVLMITVMFALYSIFDMSLRVFSFGNDKVEATENARIGLAKMEREIRAAYPRDKTNGDETLFFTDTDPTAEIIVFGNDVDGDRVVSSSEEVRYELSGTTLLRNGQPAVEYVSALDFEFQDKLGNSVTYDVSEIVDITLIVTKDGRTQTLQTDVSLRNRVT